MSMFDPLILQVDLALRTLFARAPTARTMPGSGLPEAEMAEAERLHVAALMRVNHVGEVCAQALYAGQAFAAEDRTVQQALEQAAWEETEHLNWTERRIAELGGRKSLLNPLWYLGAWTIGAVAGRLGDPVSLGFLAETERQVEAHLDGHLERLPVSDLRSRAIVQQMKLDEIEHAETAVKLGASELSGTTKGAMRLAARFMTGTAYWV
jgi:ubiquinone biosynthesis monooxygenase Coq7